MLRRRIDHEPAHSYAEMFDHLQPGELLARQPPAGAGRATGRSPTPTRSDPDRRRVRGDRMTTVAELIDRVPRRARRDQSSGAWSATPSTRSPTPSGARTGIEWIGVRHEEAGAFAAERPGPADRHARRLHGHRRSRARSTCSTACTTPRSRTRPVLAICGQVPREDIGSDFFQEVDNDRALRRRRGLQPHRHQPRPAAAPARAGRQRRARTTRGVAVLTLPGDVGGLDLPNGTAVPQFVGPRRQRAGAPTPCSAAAALLNAGRQGHAARRAGRPRGPRRGAGARRPLSAPMVLTLKAKEGFERRQPLRGRPVAG